ncbi:MAG TPA: acyl carrier protein [Pyrinomonadaceae bacterium]|jgi:acyl carrier protein|nr:acyl carrier protein [Pyrinomonadaceae bacterium]
MNNNGTFAEVSALVRQTLAAPDTEPVLPEQLLFYDLNFTSIDLLDLLFRLEQHFNIRIPEGTIYKLARGEMPDAEFAQGSVLTDAGRERLMRLLHDSPPQIFPARIHVTTLPRYCTVGAITRLVEHKLAEA